MTLFSRLGVAASWVLHILCINLFASRWCLMEGGCGGCLTVAGGASWRVGAGAASRWRVVPLGGWVRGLPNGSGWCLLEDGCGWPAGRTVW